LRIHRIGDDVRGSLEPIFAQNRVSVFVKVEPAVIESDDDWAPGGGSTFADQMSQFGDSDGLIPILIKPVHLFIQSAGGHRVLGLQGIRNMVIQQNGNGYFARPQLLRGKLGMFFRRFGFFGWQRCRRRRGSGSRSGGSRNLGLKRGHRCRQFR